MNVLVFSVCPHCRCQNKHLLKVERYGSTHVVFCDDDEQETCGERYVVEVKMQFEVDSYKMVKGDTRSHE